MAATAPSRSARSTARAFRTAHRPRAIRAFARVIRCSIAASPTRKARAICRHRQAGDDAQRQRDLLGRRQIGMAAHEHQAQDIVAVVGLVDNGGAKGEVRRLRDPSPRPGPPSARCSRKARRMISSPETNIPVSASLSAGAANSSASLVVIGSQSAGGLCGLLHPSATSPATAESDQSPDGTNM